ncbi:hypothetical protein GCM10020001_029920 [Nonomuraea salmonea]
MDVVPFGPGSMHWDTAGEYRNLLIAGSALVLQTMHPAVGGGRGGGSTRRTSRIRGGRLQRTLISVQKWVYGGAEGPAEGQRLRRLHEPIGGVDEQGRRYHALNGEAWAWVHLTLFERFITLNRYFGTPYTTGQLERFYEESRQLGAILRVPEREVPADLPAFRAYFDRMVAERLEAHPTALDVLAAMRGTPAPPGLPAPLRRLWRPVGGRSGGADVLPHGRHPATGCPAHARLTLDGPRRTPLTPPGPRGGDAPPAPPGTPALHAARLPGPPSRPPHPPPGPSARPLRLTPRSPEETRAGQRGGWVSGRGFRGCGWRFR